MIKQYGSINKKHWCFGWAAVPLVLGLICLLIYPAHGRSSFLEVSLLFLSNSMIMGGVQYAVMVAMLAYIFRRKSAAFFCKLTLILPLLYMPFLLGGLLLYCHLTGDSALARILPFITIFALIIGYAYVLAYHVITFVVSQFVLLRD